MILVTGASGFVGKHLVKALLENNLRVRALVRDVDKAKRSLPSGVEPVKGDMTDADSLSSAARGIETVINLVGIISGSESLYRAVHTEGTRRLVAAARENGARRIIYISANGASQSGATAYFRTKWEAEEEVRKSGLEYTILRPSVLFGPDDAFVNQLAFGIRMSPVFPVFGSGEYRFQPLFIKDLTTCIVRSLSEPAAVNETVEVGGPEALTFNEIVDGVALVLGRRVFKIHIPLSIIKAGAGVMGSLMSKPPVSVDQVAMMESGNTCDIARMRSIFKIEPVPFMEGVRGFIGYTKSTEAD